MATLIYFSRFCSAKSHVKPLELRKIQQLSIHQHLADKRKVRISYMPLGKLDIERQQRVFRLFKRANKSKARPPAGPNLLILDILAVSPLFGQFCRH
jgi:hypothetical protein